MSHNEDMKEVEISIAEAQDAIDFKRSLQNLIDNADFKKVITDGYFSREASRIVLMKADPEMQTPENQLLLNKQIDAVGFFRQFIRTQMHIGRLAEEELAAHQATREELLGEDIDA